MTWTLAACQLPPKRKDTERSPETVDGRAAVHVETPPTDLIFSLVIKLAIASKTAQLPLIISRKNAGRNVLLRIHWKERSVLKIANRNVPSDAPVLSTTTLSHWISTERD